MAGGHRDTWFLFRFKLAYPWMSGSVCLTAPLLALDQFEHLTSIQVRGEGGMVKEAVGVLDTAEGSLSWQTFIFVNLVVYIFKSQNSSRYEYNLNSTSKLKRQARFQNRYRYCTTFCSIIPFNDTK